MALRLAAALVLLCASLACAPFPGEIPALPPLDGDLQQKYDAYIAATEARIQREVRSTSYLWAERSPERWRRVRKGEVVVEPWNPHGRSEFGNGLLHDWIGAMFVPATTLARVTSFLQDYASHKNYFRPEVVDSALVGHDGEDWKIRYRIVKKYIITVVVNTDQTANYTPLSPTRLLSRSVATRIAEVKDAGQAGEHEVDSRKETSIVWRLNTYWRLEEKDGGVFVECEAISLTRAAPRGLRWLLNPIIRPLPGASLAHVLEATRNGALGEGASGSLQEFRKAAFPGLVRPQRPVPRGTPSPALVQQNPRRASREQVQTRRLHLWKAPEHGRGSAKPARLRR